MNASDDSFGLKDEGAQSGIKTLNSEI